MTNDALFEPARYDKAPALFDAELAPHPHVADAGCYCPDDCRCRRPFAVLREGAPCGCRAHERTATP